jgi:hypothetical protein
MRVNGNVASVQVDVEILLTKVGKIQGYGGVSNSSARTQRLFYLHLLGSGHMINAEKTSGYYT